MENILGFGIPSLEWNRVYRTPLLSPHLSTYFHIKKSALPKCVLTTLLSSGEISEKNADKCGLVPDTSCKDGKTSVLLDSFAQLVGWK